MARSSFKGFQNQMLVQLVDLQNSLLAPKCFRCAERYRENARRTLSSLIGDCTASQFHNEIDLVGSGGLRWRKSFNIKTRETFSSSSFATVCLCQLQHC